VLEDKILDLRINERGLESEERKIIELMVELDSKLRKSLEDKYDAKYQ
jgi:hypothetical protein